jgi:hypothetical protein
MWQCTPTLHDNKNWWEKREFYRKFSCNITMHICITIWIDTWPLFGGVFLNSCEVCCCFYYCLIWVLFDPFFLPYLSWEFTVYWVEHVWFFLNSYVFSNSYHEIYICLSMYFITFSFSYVCKLLLNMFCNTGLVIIDVFILK